MSYGPPTAARSDEPSSGVYLQIIKFMIRRFKIDRFLGNHRLQPYVDFVLTVNKRAHWMRHDWTSREVWFSLCILEAQVAKALDEIKSRQAPIVWASMFQIALKWFSHAPM